MIYCSLDQALQTSGWSIWNNNNLIEYGTFKTKSTDPIEKRLGTIWQQLDNLLNKYDFTHLFFEDVQKQTNVETFKKLAYVHAAVLLWCYWKEIPYTILAPSHWRSVLKENYHKSFGRARAEQKKAAQELAENVCGASVTSDEADALCIALAGIIEYNKNKSAF